MMTPVPFRAYFVRCADDTLYCGIAIVPVKRTVVHNSGRGARYTKTRLPVTLVWQSAQMPVGDALRYERRLKRLSKAAKLKIIGGSSV